MHEENLVFGHGTSQIDWRVEVVEGVHQLVQAHDERLVHDDTECAFRFVVVDEQYGRPSEVKVVHGRLRKQHFTRLGFKSVALYLKEFPEIHLFCC